MWMMHLHVYQKPDYDMIITGYPHCYYFGNVFVSCITKYFQTNPFADDEAAEEDEGDNAISDDDNDEMNLKLDISDEESG